MSLIAKLKKDESKLVAEELKLNVPENAKVLDLKNLIEKSAAYNTDLELVKCVVEYVVNMKAKIKSLKVKYS